MGEYHEIEGSLGLQGEGGLAPSDLGLIGFAMEVLRDRSQSDAQIDAGLLRRPYQRIDQLPTTGLPDPAYAVVLEGDGSSPMYIAWWDGAMWSLSAFPWFKPPPVIPGGGKWLINPDSAVGTGNSTWNFGMGTEFHITAAGNGKEIREMAFKFGTNADGLSHAWAIRKSTVTAPLGSPPAASSYTNVVASGVIPNATTPNGWQVIGIPSVVPILQDEWYVAMVWVGLGGQTGNINTLRTQGQFDETFADVTAGRFGTAPGPNPGSTPVPTGRSTTTLYGITTVGIGPE